MENIYLKFPTIEDKEKVLEYFDEYIGNNPAARPLDYTKNLSYEQWLDKRIKEHAGDELEEGRVPASVYFLVHNDRFVGHISIRHSIETEFLSTIGGHIGYGVRPNERRKGYATTMLGLALKKCKDLGINDLLITCEIQNIGSAKTIENNLGTFEKEIYSPIVNANFKRYWIDVEKSLDKTSNMKI